MNRGKWIKAGSHIGQNYKTKFDSIEKGKGRRYECCNSW